MQRLFILLVILGLTACGSDRPQPVPAQTAIPPPNIQVAYGVDGNLSVWQPETGIQQIASGGVIQPIIAPDAQRIAYTSGSNGLPEHIGVVDINGGNPRQLVNKPIIGQVAWLNDHTLYFNTLELGELGLTPRLDLHRLDVDNGIITPLPTGGNFSINPDGTHMIVIKPGTYGESSGQLLALDPNAPEHAVTLLEFPAVATGSHTPYDPQITWLSPTTAWLALPHPDALYNDFEADAQPYTLWQLDITTGQAQQTGQVQASYFGEPVISADGGQITYLKRNLQSQGFDLISAAADGSNPTLVVSGEQGTLLAPQWLGQQLMYAYDGAYWTAGQRTVEINPIAMTQPRIIGTTVVYITIDENNQFDLRYAPIGDSFTLSTRIAQTGNTVPMLDAVELPD